MPRGRKRSRHENPSPPRDKTPSPPREKSPAPLREESAAPSSEEYHAAQAVYGQFLDKATQACWNAMAKTCRWEQLTEDTHRVAFHAFLGYMAAFAARELKGGSGDKFKRTLLQCLTDAELKHGAPCEHRERRKLRKLLFKHISEYVQSKDEEDEDKDENEAGAGAGVRAGGAAADVIVISD